MKGVMGGYAKDAAQELSVGIARKEYGEVFNDTNEIPVILYVITESHVAISPPCSTRA